MLRLSIEDSLSAGRRNRALTTGRQTLTTLAQLAHAHTFTQLGAGFQRRHDDRVAFLQGIGAPDGKILGVWRVARLGA
jgi:hypothetical protein